MRRLFFSIILILFPLIWMSGCTKKPQPEPLPDPMTEAYLLAHTQRSVSKDGSVVNISLPGLVTQPRFGEMPALLKTTFDTELTLENTQEVSTLKAPKYLLLLSLQADAWGGFRTAVDTVGKRHDVLPYTSYIRSGVYYDNFYLYLTREWLEHAVLSETSLLFLGAKGELSVTIPAVYPRAMLHAVDAETDRPGDTVEAVHNP